MSSFVEPKKRVPVKLNTPLAHSFGFDFGDLQDNQAGYISHWQKKRLRWYLMNYTISILIWIFIATVFPLGLFFTFVGNIDAYGLLTSLWFGSVLAVFGMIWLWKVNAAWSDMQEGKVTELMGQMSKDKSFRKKQIKRGKEIYERPEHDYTIWIDKKRFQVSYDQMMSFSDGKMYKVYLATKSRQILSAELLDESQKDIRIDFLSEPDDVSLEEVPEEVDLYLTHRKRKRS